MASTSVSSIQKRFKYDVFLSFRGEDTRKSFVDHLYHALHQKGILTYKDNERIEKGERISDQLITSIQDSRFHIIVFSKSYASSSWCLDELVQIMECQRTMEQTAYPVFYDVEPTQVRNQSGAVGEAFAKHVEKEVVGTWRDALKEAANLAGWELKNTVDGHEAKFIQKIVLDISIKLHFINSSIDEKLVGMETRVTSIISSLEIDSSDVRMIGIKGMGGGGKTTLARAVFDHISIWFEGKSFIENVRDVSKGSGLKELQRQVISDVLNDQSIVVSDVSNGKNMIKKMIGSRKVLFVLDDVDDVEQLEALAGERNWFKPGSKIIMTTRDEHVLVAHRVNFIHDVNLLSHEEALCLFSRYAFGRETPIQGYEELSVKVVKYAAGLPLTLKVLGSFLCGRPEREWVDALERLKTIPLKQTLKKLELSYDGLENDHKEMFLDVACILKGEKKEVAIRILEGCGFHAQIGLRVLEQKSLITISNFERLGMHDHIEEMGRNIVRQLHTVEPNKHKRLWIKEEIENVLANDLGTEATRSIKMKKTDLHPCVIMKGLRKMKELRFLYVYKGGFREGKIDLISQYLPNALRSLYWPNYPYRCLPKTFHANKLVNLEICGSSISQLWEGGERKVLGNLIFLDLSYSKVSNFNLGMTPQLEELNLERCDDFVELYMPFECPKLKILNLRGSRVTNLNLMMTPNLETTYLEDCNNLVELRMPFECPNLKFMFLARSKLSKLNLRLTPQLEILDLGDCNNLVEVRMPVECPKLKCLDLKYSKLSNLYLGLTPHLETLDLSGCNDLVEFHMAVECSKLKSLFLGGSRLSNLDLRLTPHLETLQLGGCNELVELHIPVECPKLKILNLCGSKASNLNLGLIPHLEMLYLEECYYLREIHAPAGCLEKLVDLKLSGCARFERFVGSKSEVLPGFDSLATLELIAESVDICPLHSNNNLPKFRFNGSYFEPVSSLSGNLRKLISFGLCACTNPEFFSASICGLQGLGKLTLEGSIPEALKYLHQLETLERLTLSVKEIKHLPDSICLLKHLKYLEIKSCWHLEQLPNDLGRLECLEELYLTDCISLRNIPNGICEMKCLEYLHIPNCILVGKLPEELGCLERLKELNIEGAGISHLPLSIFQLKGICIVGSKWQLESYGFTSLNEISRNTTCCYVKL